MKKYLVVLAAMAFLIVMVGGAYAASPTTLDVTASATVKTNCVVSSGATLAFGDIDADGADVNATASGISIKCTKGTVVTVADNDGLDANKMQSGANRLPYTTAYTASLTGGGTGGGGTELGDSAAGHLNFRGTVPVATAAGVPAGVYGDTITLTLTY